MGTASAQTNVARVFPAHGTVLELHPADQTIVIRHDAITGYMGAMTMPFKARNATDLSDLAAGDEIAFKLEVNATESHVENIVKIGHVTLSSAETNRMMVAPAMPQHTLMDYKFTNELGQAVCFNDFHGQAMAITFFYTRCPLPEYCPRLSRNFQEASVKLAAMTNAPTNWHFISVSFDTEVDTPEVLKAYAATYQADPAHWSFLTGPADRIAALARSSGANYQYEDGTFNHNFRTLIIDPDGHLETIFPMGGDLSDMIVEQMLKAAAKTNQLASKSH